MPIERRTIAELMTKYELEPDLDDVYVEGAFDKEVVDLALNYTRHDRPVFCIDDIEVDSDVLKQYQLTDGNRQRLVALCYKLSLKSGTKVRFLVDRDHDAFLGQPVSANGLVFTKYCDLEGVFLSEKIVRQLVEGAGGAKIADWSSFFLFLESTVKGAGAVRIVSRERKHNVSVPSLRKSMSLKERQPIFCLEDFAAKVFSHGNVDTLPDIVRQRLNYWCTQFEVHEARNAGCGHDYFDVISWAIDKFNGSATFMKAVDRAALLFVPEVANEILEPIN